MSLRVKRSNFTPTPESPLEIIGMGAINVDCLCQVKEIVTDAETTIDRIKTAPGGSAANTIYGLSRLGIKTGFIGAVGDDEEGKASVQDLETMKVDTSQIQIKKGERTGYTLCLSDKLGRRSIYVLPGANNLLEWQDINLTYLNQAKIVHLSSFVNHKQFNTQIKLIERQSNSVKISFAPGMLYAIKGIKALSPLLARTDILFINRKEIEQLTHKNFTAGAKECLELGCQIVVVTLGKGLALESGKVCSSYICQGKEEYKIESSPRHHQAQLEATGAGDAFATGFLFGFLKGKNLPQCGQLGNAAAGYAMSKTGAREGLPSLSQLRVF